MKTIREQASEIMKEDTSHDVKREKLLKIGLTATDIQNLFFAERMATKEGRAARPVVEYTIEQILARSLKKHFSSSVKKGIASIDWTGALNRWSADQCTSLIQKRAQ